MNKMAMRENIEKRLKAIFKKNFNINLEEIAPDDFDKNLLGKVFRLSARDLLKLFFDIEKEFCITIPEDEIIAGRFNSFNNIADIIHTQFHRQESEAV